MIQDNQKSLFSKLEEVIKHNLTSMTLDVTSKEFDAKLSSLQQELKQEVQLTQRQQLIETFVHHTPATVAILDLQMTYLLASDRWIEYFQLDQQDIIGRNHYQVFPEIPEHWRQHYEDCLSGKVSKIETEEDNFIHSGKKVDWLRWKVLPWQDMWGEIGGLIIFSEVNTERILLQKKIESCEAQMRSMFAGMNELVFTIEVDNNCILFLPTRFFEIYEDNIVNQVIEGTHNQLFDGEEAEDYQNLIRQVLKTQKAIDFDYSLQVDDSLIWYSAKLSPTSSNTVIWVARDITKRREIEQHYIYTEKELAQVTLQSIGDGVISTDALGQIQYINPVAERLTGWNVQQAKGKYLTEVFQLVREATRKPITNPIKRVSSKNKVCKLSTKNLLISRNGSEYAVEGLASAIKDTQGQLFGVVIVFRDVTKALKTARKLSWQAFHDSLTKLYNRRKFEEEVTLAIEEIKTYGFHHALCYLDLDRFKIVNDTCGHQAGDRLLQQVTRLLKTRIRSSDVLARVGGDEFAILLHECSIEQALAIANQLVTIIGELRFVWEDKVFRIGASIGLVALDFRTESMSELLTQVDSACYAAKEIGGNCVYIYDERDLIVTQKHDQRQWLTKLNQALENNNFRLYAQKIVSIEQNDLDVSHTKQGDETKPTLCDRTHYEVLLRLIDDSGNLIAPGLFLPAAERYGLMPAIDRWVVNNFLAGYEVYCQSRKKRKLEPFKNLYTINLSGASINNQEFGNFLKMQFERYSIPPQTICFEITETVAITNLDNALILIEQLKELGCSIALDDFGSGMSSFNYLKNLPIDYLKIDGSFVKNIVSDRVDYATVESFNRISQIMNIKTIAEFVENNAIMQNLKQIGIDYAQGYGIERPQPLVWH